MDRTRKKNKTKKKVLRRRKKSAPIFSAQGIEQVPTAKVFDLRVKQTEKLTEEIKVLSQRLTQGIDERVELIVDAYHEWEQANPELRLRAHEKMSMVRYGFIGPGGFDRCHELDRLPESAFFTADGDVADEIRTDRDASEVVMCPAMESGRCQEIWRGMRAPPCHLLLLEVSHGLGGGADDMGLQIVLDDFGLGGGPDDYAQSFVRAERLVRKYEERGEPGAE